MQKFYGKIEKVYIPTENNQDVMFSNKIGFIIKIEAGGVVMRESNILYAACCL